MNDNKKHSGNNNNRDQHRINEAITAREVRLTGDNVNQGIYPIQEALRIADRAGLDLVEIAAEANPPVCRVIDYQKFIYQKKKKLKEQKSNSVKVVIKEIRFGPQTDDHDYNFKLKHARSFIGEGSKVKAYVFFRGLYPLQRPRGSASTPLCYRLGRYSHGGEHAFARRETNVYDARSQKGNGTQEATAQTSSRGPSCRNRK